MNEIWLVVDMHCLAYRNFYALGGLSFEGEPTAVSFGVLRDLQNLKSLHNADLLVLCFDGGYDKRREIDPLYKANRKPKDESEQERAARRSLRRQMYRLRTNILPRIGFKNILWEEGYEADDWIAKVCVSMPRGVLAVIVSRDNDLYQLLSSGRVLLWDPKTKSPYTAQMFGEEYGISPSQWADVKAIAGCNSDNVIGVKGVGNKTAAKFLRGELKPESKAHKDIVASNEVWRRNIELTRLPMRGLPEFEPREDKATMRKWRAALDKLGISSLV